MVNFGLIPRFLSDILGALHWTEHVCFGPIFSSTCTYRVRRHTWDSKDATKELHTQRQNENEKKDENNGQTAS